MGRSLFLTVILILLLASAETDAQKLVVRTPGSRDSVRIFSPGTVVAASFRGHTLLSATAVAHDARARFILRFGKPPLLLRRSGAEAAASVNASTEALQMLPTRVPGARIVRRFTDVLDGAVVTAARGDLLRLRELPGVTSVTEDAPVAICSAPESRTSPGLSPDGVTSVSGTGIRIGILDTGVDYLHEALGGGIGPGFKVAGGHDFVNHDDDPMDDNGHGTHVAGIVAGSSATLRGTAPGAQLYAYKVLDASGNGFSSDVIAAIEQAVRDSVQVLNISLSAAGGDPLDPLSEAVDAAVASGIVVVAAAGNGGGIGTIGSPGAAAYALTVGADNGSGGVATFSSSGPTLRNFGLKPDLVAPGTDILSARLNGGYVKMSGTSMAAPYVAGIAADLRQIHPLWSPAEIAGAITASTRSLGAGFFSQGHGAIDTGRVWSRALLASPASLTFGFDAPGTPEYARTDTFVVVNGGSTSASVTISVVKSSPGYRVELSRTSATLGPGESLPTTATLVADNTLLADNTALEQGYTGSIRIASQEDTTLLPFAFFKGNAVQMSFDERPMQVVLCSQNGEIFSYNPSHSALTAVIPSGTYDIIAHYFGSTFVVREKVQTPLGSLLSLSRSEAVDTISIVPGDEAGRPLAKSAGDISFTSLEALLVRNAQAGEVVTEGGPLPDPTLSRTVAITPFSDRIQFVTSYTVQYGNTASYTFDASLDSGLSANRAIRYLPGDLRRVDFKYKVDSSVSRIFPVAWTSLALGTILVEVTYYNGNDAPLLPPFVQESYYSKQPGKELPVFHRREAYRY